MTLDELLASQDYQSAAPDDRMRRIDDWALTAKQEFPEEAEALDAEVPRLRAREFVTAALPTLNLSPDAAARFRDLYQKGHRPEDSAEPEDWQRFDQEYTEKDAALAGMTPEERLQFGQFQEVMDRAGRHYQTAEEAKKGERASELNYGMGVKFPIKTKTLHDRKLVTITYPDGTPETFEYALDEPPPSAERLRTFMLENRADRLGEWESTLANLGAHAANAGVDITVGGLQFGKDVAQPFAGGDQSRFLQNAGAHLLPLFTKLETGPDGRERWVKRPKDEFLSDMDDEEWQSFANEAVQVAKGIKPASPEFLSKLTANETVSNMVRQTPTFGGTQEEPTNIIWHFQGDEDENVPPPAWLAPTAAERKAIGVNLARQSLSERQETREGYRPFNVDPANLLATQEDQLNTDGSWWGAKALDWLGDKAFNVPTVGQAVGSAVPTLAGGLVAGPAGVAPFALAAGMAEGNQAFEEVMQRNLDAGMDAETARNRAMGAGIAYAAVATALEQAGGVFETKVFQGTIGKTRGGRALMGFVPESTEETTQSIAQDLIANANVPEEQKLKAMEIATKALEAGAGALSFGVIPGAKGAMAPNPTPLDKAAVDVLEDPALPPEAKAAVAETATLEAQATALREAGKAAAAKAAPAEESAPEPATDEAIAQQEQAEIQRQAVPLTYADESGDYVYQGGAWLQGDGTPAPNAAELDARRQEYIRTGELPEGMQEAVPAPAASVSPEPTSVAPAAQGVTEPAKGVSQPAPASEGIMPTQETTRTKGSRVTGKDGRRGEIVREDNGNLTVEWADGTTSEIAEGDLASRSTEATTTTKNKVVISAIGHGFSVIYYDENGEAKNIFQVAGRESTGGADAAYQEAVERAQKKAAEKGLAGYFDDSGKLVKTPQQTKAPAPTPATSPTQEAESPTPAPGSPSMAEPAQATVPPPQEAPAASVQPPTEPPKERKNRTARRLHPLYSTMRTRDYREHPTIQNDIISQTKEQHAATLPRPRLVSVKEPGRKRRWELAPEYRTAEWEWFRPYLENNEERAILDDILGAEESDPKAMDAAASAFGMTGDQYGQAIAAAAQERIRIAKAMREGGGVTPEEQQMQSAEEQRVAFEKATDKGKGKQPITTWELNPGDTMEVDGTPFRVTDVDPDTGAATLQDGTRFGRQTLETGDVIWVEEHAAKEPSEPLPKFSAAEQPELQFERPLTIDQIVDMLDDSARVPGMTEPELAAEVQRLAGSRIQQLADALGYKGTAKDIAQQLLAENRGASAQKRADEAAPEKPEGVQTDTAGVNERPLTEDEKLERRTGTPDEAPEGTRPEDFEDDTPQPNPLMRFSTGRTASVTSQQDADYLGAVARGDMETAQRMVDEAAKRSGLVKINRSNGDGAPSGYYAHETARLGDLNQTEGAVRKINDGTFDELRESLEGVPPSEVEPLLVDAPDESGKRDVFNGNHRVEIWRNYQVLPESTDIPILGYWDELGVTRDAQGNVIPLSERFKAESGDIRFSAKEKTISKGATTEEVASAKKGLEKLLPNIQSAWTGTRAELEKHLAADARFRWQWKKAWKMANPNASEAAANDAFQKMLETGLDGKEGFTFAKRTYLIQDQVDIRESDGTPANAVRRVLIHEDAHEGLRHLRDRDATVDQQWQSFRNAIPGEELDALVPRYPWLSNWRTSPDQHDEIADEWFAKKIAEVEARGTPAADSLVGRFIKWLKDLLSKVAPDNRTTTDKALLEFMDAARMARFRDRAEAAARGIRFSVNTGAGDMPPKNVIQTQLENEEWRAETLMRPPMRTRYNLMSQEQRDAYEKWIETLPDELKMLTQFLGNPTSNIRLRQSLPILVNYARSSLGSVTGDSPKVTPENTEKAWSVVKAMLTRKTFAKKYQQEFQDLWSPTDDAGRAIHQGDAAAAVLQMEVMDYAVRLAATTGDTRMMSMLYPFANDMVLSDYQTMSGAARILQVRSMAVRNNGVWTSLRLTYAAMEKAAEDTLGKEGLEKMKQAVDTSANDALNKEVNEAIDESLENTATGEAIAEAVETSTGEEYETEGYWERVLNAYSGEERSDLYAFWQSLVKLDRLLQLQEALEAKAGSQLKASMADDIARMESDPKRLQQAIAEEKAKLMQLLGKLTKDDASDVTKDARRELTKNKKVKRAVKVLSETAQAKAMIQRFENRNKRLKRDKPAWRKGFEEQVKNPKSKDEFVKAMIAAGVTEQTSNRLFDVAAEIHTERAAAKKTRTKADPKTQEKKEKAAATALEKKVTGDYKQPTAERAGDLKRDLEAGRITQAEYDAELAKLPVKAKKERLADTRAFLSSIARQITGAPVEQQEDPVWKRQTIINALLERGMSQKAAEEIANKLTGLIDKAIREAQAKAAIRALKTLAKAKEIDPKRLGEAIRTRGLDPLNPHPVVKALAEQAGYKALTDTQFKRLAQLDAMANDESQTKAALAYTEMERILAKVRPRKGTREIATQTWINSALSSLGVIWLNWVHPVYIMLRKTGFDLATLASDVALRKTKATDVPTILNQGFRNWMRAMSGFTSEAAFALKNDAYRTRALEMLSGTHRMAQEMEDAANAIKTGNPKEKVFGAVKWLATSTDYMRRLLASADQTWGGILHQYVIGNEAMRLLVQKGGMSAQGAAIIINRAVSEGQSAMAAHLATGAPKAESILVGKDKLQDYLEKAVGEHVRLAHGAKAGRDAAEELTTTASKEALAELGNRLPEKGANWDVVNVLLEMFKEASSAIRSRHPLAGRMLTGFITVGANILNRSAYFTPLGIARALFKMTGNRSSDPLYYSETMATEGQQRMRMTEGVVGTIMMIALMSLRRDSDDEEGFVFTGEGPENKTVRDAWQKRGHRPAHIEWVGADGQVKFSIPYSRGGLDHLALPLTFVGALDDVQLDGKKGESKNASFAWSYGGTVVKNLANQARFFGMKNLVTSVPTSLKDSSIAGNAAYMSAPFIPWSGLIKSTTRLFTGQKDQTSWNAAILAQVPIVSAFTGEPALNALGDPVGPQSMDFATKMAERLEFSGFPFFVGIDTDSRNAGLYKFMLSKGIAPAMPMRGNLESANGFISDATWRRYVKTRGANLKQAIGERMASMQFMAREDAADEMERISSEATMSAKKALNLK